MNYHKDIRPWIICAIITISIWSVGLSLYSFRIGKHEAYKQSSNDESDFMNELNRKNVELQNMSTQLQISRADKQILFQSIECVEAVEKIK